MSYLRGDVLPLTQTLNLPGEQSSPFSYGSANQKLVWGYNDLMYGWFNGDELAPYSIEADAWRNKISSTGGPSLSFDCTMEYDLTGELLYYGDFNGTFRKYDYKTDTFTNLTGAAGTSGNPTTKMVKIDSTRHASAPGSDDWIFWHNGLSQLKKYSISGDSWSEPANDPTEVYSVMYWLPGVDPTKLYFLSYTGVYEYVMYEWDIVAETKTQIGGTIHIENLANYTRPVTTTDGTYIYLILEGYSNTTTEFQQPYVNVMRIAINRAGATDWDKVQWRHETNISINKPLTSYPEVDAHMFSAAKVNGKTYLYYMDIPLGGDTSLWTPHFGRVQLLGDATSYESY